jgi:hypothetical protein
MKFIDEKLDKSGNSGELIMIKEWKYLLVNKQCTFLQI